MKFLNGYKTLIGIVAGLLVALCTTFNVTVLDAAHWPHWLQVIYTLINAVWLTIGRLDAGPVGPAKAG